MATNNDDGHKPGEPSHIHLGPTHETKKFNWLPWLLLALGLLALLFALSRCGRDREAVAPAPVVNETETVTNTTTTTTTTTPGSLTLPGGAVLAVTPNGINEQVGGFLAGTEPTPSRAFQFDKLNFDTAKADIRPQDQGDIDAMAQILQAYPNARIKVVGYADARGSDPANKDLGQRRAEAVKAALGAKGVAANRVETASGGEDEPVATNATSGGQAENRRTEVVIVSR